MGEETLQGISLAQEKSADALIALVKEDERVIIEIKDNLRQRIVQDVLGFVVRSDRDNNGVLCEKETVHLALAIRLHLQDYGVEFDEQKFRKVMGKGTSSVAQTLRIVRRLIPNLSEEDEEGEDEDDYDMFHMAVSSRSVVGGKPSGDSDVLLRSALAIGCSVSRRMSGGSHCSLSAWSTRIHCSLSARSRSRVAGAVYGLTGKERYAFGDVSKATVNKMGTGVNGAVRSSRTGVAGTGRVLISQNGQRPLMVDTGVAGAVQGFTGKEQYVFGDVSRATVNKMGAGAAD